MNNKSLKLASILFIVLMSFAACNKDKGEGSEFGPQTAEDTKITIEQTGKDMIGHMRALEQSEAIDVSEAFIGCVVDSDPLYKSAKLYNSVAFKSLRNVAAMDDGVKISEIFSDMRTEEDPESIQALFNEVAGVYEWNSKIYDWDITNGGNEIIFKFPSTEGDTVNDATFRIYNYTGYNGDNYLKEYDEYNGDLPQTINAELKSGDVVVMSYSFNVSYDADGIPSSINTELFVVPFKFSASFSNSYTRGLIEYKIIHNDTEVVNLSAELNGNWSKDNIDANIEEDYYTYSDYDETGELVQFQDSERELVNPDKIFNNAKATFRILDVKMEGTLNFAGLWTEMMKIEDKYEDENGYWDLTDEEDSLYTQEEVKAINKYIAVVAKQVSTNKIIAKLEAYPYVDRYTRKEHYYDGQWNENPILVEETNYWTNMRFVFGDDSRVNAATYFGEGFDDFLIDLNDFIDDINKIYQADIDHIEYPIEDEEE